MNHQDASQYCCHGTGKRIVRLVGWVGRVTAWACFSGGEGDEEEFSGYEAGVFSLPYNVIIDTGGNERESVEEAFDELSDAIVEAYRAGTLPPEIADGLREEEVTR